MAETFSVFIDPTFDVEQRRFIGRRIIDYITTRTRAGRGIDNVPFTNRQGATSYSKAYQEHRDFEVGGKSSSPINLTLTGDMLSSLEVIDVSLPGRIIVGITDDQNAEKVKWMREKGYNFLGISQKEQDTIMAEFSQVTAQEVRASNIIDSVAQEFLRNIING